MSFPSSLAPNTAFDTRLPHLCLWLRSNKNVCEWPAAGYLFCSTPQIPCYLHAGAQPYVSNPLVVARSALLLGDLVELEEIDVKTTASIACSLLHNVSQADG